MNNAAIVRVPKESVSDDEYLVAKLFLKDGEHILEGQLFAHLETSKTVVEVVAPCTGYVYWTAAEGDRIAVGSILAAITETKGRPAELPPLSIALRNSDSKRSKFKVSEDARKLISANNLDDAIFSHLSFVRASDVEKHLQGAHIGSIVASDLPAISSNHILIWGGGGHAKVCIEILRAAGVFLPYGIVDKAIPIGTKVLGVPVIGNEASLGDVYAMGLRTAALGIGAVTKHSSRWHFFSRLKELGFELPNLVHPDAVVSPSAHIGWGNQILANATVSSDVRIGNGCIINSGVVVSHDCKIGDSVHIAPGATLAGAVSIGDNTIVGMGVTVYLGVKIGNSVRVNNGAAVSGDVPDESIVSGSGVIRHQAS